MKQFRFLNSISLCGFILLSVLAFGFASCSDNDDDDFEIELQDVENNSINFIYPNYDSQKYAATIIGGDGDFSVKCSDPAVVSVELTSQRTILMEPLFIGSAKITITDKSGNAYVLNVNVSYETQKFVIGKKDVLIKGNNLSEADKKEIEKRALATIPIGAGGGYKLIYTDPNEPKGILFVYPEVYGQNGKESTFEMRSITNIYDPEFKTRAYILNIDGKERQFMILKYQTPPVKSSQIIPHALVEDVTAQFKSEFPAVELVYTQQLLK